MKFHIALLIPIFIFTNTNIVLAQKTLKSGEINLTIPLFTHDHHLDTPSSVLVRRKILQPISKSTADIELRIGGFDHEGLHVPTGLIVLKCINGKVTKQVYVMRWTYLQKTMTGYTDIGPLEGFQSDTHFFYKALPPEKLPASTLKNLINALNENHFTNLPDWEEFVSLAKETDPQIQAKFVRRSCDVEIKIGSHYKSLFNNIYFFYSGPSRTTDSPTIDTPVMSIKEYSMLLNSLETISNFVNSNLIK